MGTRTLAAEVLGSTPWREPSQSPPLAPPKSPGRLQSLPSVFIFNISIILIKKEHLDWSLFIIKVNKNWCNQKMFRESWFFSLRAHNHPRKIKALVISPGFWEI